MTATAHALVGGAIAASISNPAIGIPLSIASHPFLDMIPHWDFGWGWRQKTKTKLFIEASFDLLLGVVLAFLFFGNYTNFWYLAACIFGSEIGDLLQVPYWLLNWKFPPFSWIYKTQSAIQGKAKLPWGILTQVVTIAFIVFILQVLPKL